MSPWMVTGILAAVGALWVWRYFSYKALLNAMRENRQVRLPPQPFPEYANLTHAYHRIRAKARNELNIINSQRNELSALLAAMTDAVVALDRNQRILNLNQSAEELFGLASKDAIGKEFLEISRNPELHGIVEETLKGELPVSREIVLPHSTQSRSVLVNGTPYESPEHKRGAVLVIRDVTRLRQLEEHRRQFVANVSHELKTPITSLKGYAETLLEGAIDEEETARQFVGIISKQSNRLSALVDDLLQLSRLEQQEEFDLIPRRIYNVAESAVMNCQELAKKRKSDLKVDGSRDLLAPCNAESLEIAVRNLVENALKYSPPESEVNVLVTKADGFARIAVEDNGPGIAQEHQSRLFERFYRVDKSRSSALGGTGLGLAIVKHIAQAHHGTVRVNSITGQGSTFTLEWPLE